MKNILVVFGFKSSEHEISCKSAYSILSNIDKSKYNFDMAGIDKSGNWFKYTGDILNIKENTWVEDKDNKIKIDNIIEFLKKYDIVFPVLHGKYGEDGAIQGLFEIAEVKYVGCKVLGSSIAMNKTISKKLVQSENIPVVEYVNITKDKFNDMLSNSNMYNAFIDKVAEKIGFPMFIKPNQEGSSYGVSKVNKKDEIKDAMEYALGFDSTVLIEKYISNKKEVECAVIKKDGKLFISTPGEICSATEVYDYNSKYNNEKSYTNIPANIPVKKLEKVKEYSKKIFEILNLTSLSRIDFFVTDENIYFNEVNTMPGFTDISMYPKMLEYDGIKYSKIIDILIENVVEENI